MGRNGTTETRPWVVGKEKAMKRKVDTWLHRTERYGSNREPTAMEASRESVLADWLGPERDASVKADIRDMTEDVSVLVKEVLASIGKEEMLQLTQLQDHWKEIVGEDNARMSAPLSLSGGVLRIKVFNASYRFIFERQLKAVFMAKICETAGKNVKRLEFVC